MESQIRNKFKSVIYWSLPIILAILHPMEYHLLVSILETAIDSFREFMHIHYYLQDAEMPRYLFVVTGHCTVYGFPFVISTSYVYLYLSKRFYAKRYIVMLCYMVFWIGIAFFVNFVPIGIYLHYIRVGTVYMLFYFIPFLIFAHIFRRKLNK